jgi:hypothetical protein
MSTTKTTVIHHSADFDGIFCREIARKFLPDAELIGWDFGDKRLALPDGPVYVLDLPVDRVFGFNFAKENEEQTHEEYELKLHVAAGGLVWIDHHKSSIETHPTDIPGYRIDGVAACRLAWQWFSHFTESDSIPTSRPACLKEDFQNRLVDEPLAVRLAGEYDIWDKRDPDAELFQHGLRSQNLDGWWEAMLSDEATATVAEIENRLEQGSKFELLPNGNIRVPGLGGRVVAKLLRAGKVIQFVRENEYRDVITQQGFDIDFEGLTFLACCSHELDIRSQLFTAGIKPHHEALLGFTFTGSHWRVSMYRISDGGFDLSKIAAKHGGGGHSGACGFIAKTLPFAL